uniref:Ig-like domain-containing protein n=2 Tax=Photinus pyralis TaxID=7054 RepID=A0A1Y1L7B2_PHOPY
MVSITCTVNKGDLPLNISWLLNEKSVANIDTITTLLTNKRISQLSIETLRAEHAGEYACIASNRAGTATFKAQLNINGTYYFVVRTSCVSVLNLHFFHCSSSSYYTFRI